MKFSRLHLSGFKSFIDPVDLDILPGLTAIVGPNGCGKSNLLEALRWVMGETSYKSMRGSGMEDVIFSGTNTRPPRNFAEVSLQLDNTDHSAPAEYNNADMVEVVRYEMQDHPIVSMGVMCAPVMCNLCLPMLQRALVRHRLSNRDILAN